jgi:hypothetical protein
MLNEDYKEMLQCLLEEDVRFLLLRGPSPAHRRSGCASRPTRVGAYAVAVYGYPRATKDIVDPCTSSS